MKYATASFAVLGGPVRGVLIAIALTCGLQSGVSATTAARPAADTAPVTLALDHCSWDHPGINPFMGDVVAAVDRYRDIPAEVRARLKARMAKREYDDLVSIRRDSVAGRGGYAYGSAITDMHFGTHQLCRSVTRASWSPTMEERGLVYCESGHCILVPTVCRNVSRVSRRGVGNDIAEGPSLLDFAPPGAGPAVAADDPGAAPAVLLGLTTLQAFDPATAWSSAAPGAAVFGGVGPVGFSAGAAASAPPSLPTTTHTSAIPPAGPGTAIPPVVTAVPEPQTWALLLGGLAALALFARRRAVTRRAAA